MPHQRGLDVLSPDLSMKVRRGIAGLSKRVLSLVCVAGAARRGHAPSTGTPTPICMLEKSVRKRLWLMRRIFRWCTGLRAPWYEPPPESDPYREALAVWLAGEEDAAEQLLHDYYVVREGAAITKYEDLFALILLGRIRAVRGDLPGAVEVMERALADALAHRAPAIVEGTARWHLGHLYRRQGALDRARAEWKIVARLERRGPLGKVATAALAQLDETGTKE